MRTIRITVCACGAPLPPRHPIAQDPVPHLSLRRRTPAHEQHTPRARRERLQGVAFWLVFAAVVTAVCVLVPTQAA
jgi:hypothetical protein